MNPFGVPEATGANNWQFQYNPIDYSDINEVIDIDENESSTSALQGRHGLQSATSATPFVPVSLSEDEPQSYQTDDCVYPLARFLPEHLRDVNVSEAVPGFSSGEARFAELFPPMHEAPVYWRKKANRKPSQQESTGETGGDVDMKYGILPTLEECETDDEERMKRATPPRKKARTPDDAQEQDDSDVIPSWRVGPAAYWYDKLGVPMNGEYDWGFRLKSEDDQEKADDGTRVKLPEESFHLVTHSHWESDLIWEYSDTDKRNIYKNQITNAGLCSWIPSPDVRNIHRFYQSLNDMGLLADYNGPYLPPAARQIVNPDGKRTLCSLFPFECKELVHDSWEDIIIWDPLAMKRIPSPQGLVIDLNDEYLMTSIPDDVPAEPRPSTSSNPETDSRKERKSRILAFTRNNQEPQENSEDDEDEEITNLTAKDPWNLSNDEFYNPRQQGTLKANIGGSVLQHSIPALDLSRHFFPTHLMPTKLKSWHRARLKRFSKGAMSEPGKKPIESLTKLIQKKHKLREQERTALGGGQLFQMRKMEDLTAKDGEVVLFEYIEEFPPLLMQPGMATKIRNYFRRRPDKVVDLPQPVFGELSYASAHSSQFLGNLLPGQMLQALENNMFRAPIYAHRTADTDFLIIRTRNELTIREIPDIFVVGQELPLIEVQSPNSKGDSVFQRGFLMAYIYRLFKQSNQQPKRIKTEDVKRAFPHYSETTLRKRLKTCADFKRKGKDQGWWFLRGDFRLPSDEELRANVTPEECCARYSMLWAKKRLHDAGYGGKSLFVAVDEDMELGRKIEAEVLNAPWNTTHAYISAVKGKCLLALNGSCDPTGCGEAFSYQKVSFKHINKGDPLGIGPKSKRAVTGTDADLRKLPLKEAKNILRRFGVPDSEIKKMSRWEMVDYIRMLSTERAKSGRDVFSERFARLSKYSTTDHLRKFQDECQNIFTIQNRSLSSQDVMSSDDDVSSSDDDSDVERMGKNLEIMLDNRKSKIRSLEHEEKEREELKTWLLGDSSNAGPSTSAQPSQEKSQEKKDLDVEGKILKITRTLRNEETGKLYTRPEIVRRSDIIQNYVRIRTTKTPWEINQLTLSNDIEKKEELKKEKRRIQDRLRRIDRNLEKGVYDKPPPPPKEKPKEKKEGPLPNVHCSACGGYGHIRTNKVCPFYLGSQQVAMTEEQEAELAKTLNSEEGQLVDVEDTKVRFHKRVVEFSKHIRQKSLQLKIPRMVQHHQRVTIPKKPVRTGQRGRPPVKKPGSNFTDYLQRPKRPVQRRRTDPMVSLATIFERVVNEAKELPDTQLFLKPVNAKLVPDYYQIIKKPMDIQSVREKILQRRYERREQILADMQLIVENSRLYNGQNTVLTLAAESMMELCVRRFAEKERKLMKLEKAINPLMDEDDLKAISYIFETITNELKKVESSRPFHEPVNLKKVKGYADKVRIPMDISTILKNVQEHRYHNRGQYLRHVRLLYQNSLLFNGPSHPFTKTAQRVVGLCEQMLEQSDELLRDLEQRIEQTKQQALDAVETSSMATSTTTHTRDEPMEFDTMSGDEQQHAQIASTSQDVASTSGADDVVFFQEDSRPFDPDEFFSSSILRDEHAKRKTSGGLEEQSSPPVDAMDVSSDQILDIRDDLEVSDSDSSN